MNKLGRKIVLLSALLTCTTAAAQEATAPPFDEEAGVFRYTEVVAVPDVTATELYGRAKKWIALTYVSAEAVIDMDDPTSGRVVAKGNTLLPTKSLLYAAAGALPPRVAHVLMIEAKEGRYKYTLDGITVEYEKSSWPIEKDKELVDRKAVGWKTYAKRLGQVDEALRPIITDLKTSMQTAANDDW